MKEWLTLRNGFGVVCLVIFFYTTATVMTEKELYGAGPMLIVIAMLSVVVAGCCFSTSLYRMLSKPFTGFIDSIYFGNDDRDPPPVTLKLAGEYRLARRFDDAITECQRQLEYHPQSVELWSEMISIAQEAGDQDFVEALRDKAARELKGQARQLLERRMAETP
jgi:hypothetical protein